MSDWTPKAEARLRKLHDQGKPFREIAGILKREGLIDRQRSAVSSKAHSMGLKRKQNSHKRLIQAKMHNGNMRGCQWIAKKEPPFRYAPRCNAPTLPEKSWCAEHAAIVFGDPVWRHEG